MFLVLFGFLALLVSLLSQIAQSVPIDNGVKGYPQVTCGPHSIIVDVETEKPFEGRLMIKGEAHVRECVKTFAPGPPPPVLPTVQAYAAPAIAVAGPYGAPPPVAAVAGPYGGPPPVAVAPYGPAVVAPVAAVGYGAVESRVGLEIGFGQCNMRRTRTLYPRGVEYTFTMVVSFHPFFITKVDKAYRVRVSNNNDGSGTCFYMEATKEVSQQLDVSMLTTAQINQQFPMPQCQYTIKRGGPDGPLARYAKVGDALYHCWTCDRVAGWVYGILVKNCYVDDGQGNKFQLLNERGCAIDRHLLGDLTYDDLLISACVESHVFKYADKPSLYFQCTIELCFKGDGGCLGKTPPQCGAQVVAAVGYGVAPVVPVAPAVAVYPSAAPAAAVYSAVEAPAPPPPLASYGGPQPSYQPVPQPGPYRSKKLQDSPVKDYIEANTTESVPTIGPTEAKARPLQSGRRHKGTAHKRDASAVLEAIEERKINGTRKPMDAKHAEMKHADKEQSFADDSRFGPPNSIEADIVANPVVVLPFEDHSDSYDNQQDNDDLIAELQSLRPYGSARLASFNGSPLGDASGICLSSSGFGILLAIFVTVFLFSASLTAILVKGKLQRSGGGKKVNS